MARKDGLWKQKKLGLSSNPVARLWPWVFLSFSEYMHFILRERVVLMFVSQGSFEIYVIPCRSVVESKVEVTCVEWTRVTPFCQLVRGWVV